MTNLIVISFRNEIQAIEASHKLIELESFGDISVYEKVILKKNSNGDTSVIESETTDGLRALSGTALGTLAGAFAGPVGLLIGMVAGTLTGGILEAGHVDFSEDFSSKVIDKLQPGSVAIIAEIYEESPDFVDNVVAPLGGTITRSNVDYVYDEYVDDQVKQIDEDIAAQRAKIKSAAASERTKIQEKINHLKEKRKQRIAELKEKQKTRKKSRLINEINAQRQRSRVGRETK